MQTANMHGKSAFPKKIYKWSAWTVYNDAITSSRNN
jgi:hypothetical protein